MKNFLKKHWISKRGFTIAEMLIVTIIIGILLGMSTRTYYQERERFQFNNALIKMMELIKTTRNYATTSYPVYETGSHNPIIPKDGYGIYIVMDPEADKPHFIVFANTGANPNKYEEDDIILEKYELPKQIQFKSMFFDGVEQEDSDEDETDDLYTVIIFKPPLAETFLWDNEVLNQKFNELKIKFLNPTATEGSPKQFQCVRINAIKSFPELLYTDCL